MKLLIITHTTHFFQDGKFLAYGPYIREMNLWEKYVDELSIVSPLGTSNPKITDLPYTSKNIKHYAVSAFSLTDFGSTIKTIFKIPVILWILFKTMRKADHIHLRCPGNMGLLGCLVQILFPKKKKSAKYAGNWDPNAKQPLSYRIQKWILNNTFLTKNMEVMVYGNWPNTSKNIVPFFTATYPRAKIQTVDKNFEAPFKAVFVGNLTLGKNALYAVQLIQELHNLGVSISLAIYGEGEQQNVIVAYIREHKLEAIVHLHGNQAAEVVEEAYKNSHFLILASQSEGWPKVVAEAMFWGCIPLVTAISCVPQMLGQGKRGLLLTKDLNEDTKAFTTLLQDKIKLHAMSQAAGEWSQQFTLEAFEEEIRKLVMSIVNEKR